MVRWWLFFFFSSRRRHTRWPRDWSSDVCSSDLFHSDEIKDANQQHRSDDRERLGFRRLDNRVRILQLRGSQLRADTSAEPGQHTAPSARADQREETEFPKIHPDDSRRNGNEMANYRKQARKENTAGLIAAQKNFRASQLVRRHEKVLAPSQYSGATQPERDPIHNRRAEPRSQRSRDDHAH